MKLNILYAQLLDHSLNKYCKQKLLIMKECMGGCMLHRILGQLELLLDSNTKNNKTFDEKASLIFVFLLNNGKKGIKIIRKASMYKLVKIS